MGCSKPSNDYFLVIFAAFSSAAWFCFVLGFAMENSNPDRLVSYGWNERSEHFQWYLYSIVGCISIVSCIYYSLNKSRRVLSTCLILSCVSLSCIGAPLYDSGRYLGDCRAEDDLGNTRTGPGCQEETYNNYILMFAGSLAASVFHAGCVVFLALAPTNTRFTMSYEDSLSEYPML